MSIGCRRSVRFTLTLGLIPFFPETFSGLVMPSALHEIRIGSKSNPWRVPLFLRASLGCILPIFGRGRVVWARITIEAADGKGFRHEDDGLVSLLRPHRDLIDSCLILVVSVSILSESSKIIHIERPKLHLGVCYRVPIMSSRRRDRGINASHGRELNKRPSLRKVHIL
jgi:hypothetical protein